MHGFFCLSFYFESRIIMGKRLVKSSVDRKLAGVCGGIAEYLEVDPTIVRLIWVGVALIGGSGLLAYIAAALIMPEA